MRFITKVSAATAALLLISAGGANAAPVSEDDLTLAVQGGDLSVSMETAPNITASIPAGAGYSADGSMSLTVSDLRGTGEGWSVYQTLNSLDYNGPLTEVVNPMTPDHVTVTQMTSLQDRSTVGMPNDGNLPFSALSGDLATTQHLLSALPGTGMGVFNAEFGVSVSLPGNILAGNYAGRLTTTVVSGNL